MRMEQDQHQAGFTLVEMAVVLIIIGLIIGAVLKGQDLIENSRAKQFASFVRQAEVAAFAFYDRNGRFPGDAFDPAATPPINPDGIIGNEGAANIENIRDIRNSITNFEADKRIGSYSYHINYGTFASPDGGTTLVNYPCIVVTKWGGETAANRNLGSDAADQPYWFTDADLEYLKAFDTSIDGIADVRYGKVVGADHAWVYGQGVGSGVVRYDDDGGDLTIYNDSADTWDGNGGTPITPVALVYFFDRGVINP